MNIYQSLANINKQVEAIKKEKKNQQQNFMFRGIDDMMNSLHRLFAENEVLVLPEITSFTVDEKATKSGGLIYFTRANITFNFIASDGSAVKVSNVGEAMDSGDKGMNKAMSIALKYALMQMFLIPTEDIADPDAETPETTQNKIPEEDTNLLIAIDEVKRANDKAELTDVWNRWGGYHNNREFYNAVANRSKEFKK